MTTLQARLDLRMEEALARARELEGVIRGPHDVDLGISQRDVKQTFRRALQDLDLKVRIQVDQADVRRQVRAAFTGSDNEIDADVNKSKITSDIEDAANAADAEITPEADTSRLSDQIRSVIRGVQAAIDIEADTSRVERALRSAVEGTQLIVEPRAETSRMARTVRDALEGIQGVVEPRADTSRLERAVAASVAGLRAVVTPRGDGTQAGRQIKGDVEREVSSIDLGAQLRRGAGALTAGLGIGALITQGIQRGITLDDVQRRIANQLDLTADQAAQAAQAVGRVFSDGFGESLREVNDAFRFSAAVVDDFSDAGVASMERVTKQALTLADTFEQDVGRTFEAVNNIVQSGIAPNAEAALDVLNTGFRRLGPLADDLNDTFQEYSLSFANAGISASDFLGILDTVGETGIRNTDGVADAVKELNLRLTEASDSQREAFQALGVDVAELQGLYENDRGVEVLRRVGQAFQELESDTERARLAQELFGGTYEQIGDEAVLAFANIEEGYSIITGGAAAAADAVEQSLGARLQSLWREFISQTNGPVVAALETFVSAAEAAGEILSAIGDVIGGVAEGFGSLSPIADGGADSFSKITEEVSAFGEGLAPLPGLIDGVFEPLDGGTITTRNANRGFAELNDVLGPLNTTLGDSGVALDLIANEALPAFDNAVIDATSDIAPLVQQLGNIESPARQAAAAFDAGTLSLNEFTTAVPDESEAAGFAGFIQRLTESIRSFRDDAVLLGGQIRQEFNELFTGIDLSDGLAQADAGTFGIDPNALRADFGDAFAALTQGIQDAADAAAGLAAALESIVGFLRDIENGFSLGFLDFINPLRSEGREAGQDIGGNLADGIKAGTQEGLSDFSVDPFLVDQQAAAEAGLTVGKLFTESLVTELKSETVKAQAREAGQEQGNAVLEGAGNAFIADENTLATALEGLLRLIPDQVEPAADEAGKRVGEVLQKGLAAGISGQVEGGFGAGGSATAGGLGAALATQIQASVDQAVAEVEAALTAEGGAGAQIAAAIIAGIELGLNLEGTGLGAALTAALETALAGIQENLVGEAGPGAQIARGIIDGLNTALSAEGVGLGETLRLALETAVTSLQETLAGEAGPGAAIARGIVEGLQLALATEGAGLAFALQTAIDAAMATLQETLLAPETGPGARIAQAIITGLQEALNLEGAGLAFALQTAIDTALALLQETLLAPETGPGAVIARAILQGLTEALALEGAGLAFALQTAIDAAMVLLQETLLAPETGPGAQIARAIITGLTEALALEGTGLAFALQTAIDTAVTTLLESLAGAEGPGARIAQAIIEGIQTAMSAEGTGLAAILVLIFEEALTRVTEVITEWITSVVEQFTTMAEEISTVIEELTTTIETEFEEMATAVEATVDDLVDSIITKFEELETQITRIMTEIERTVVDGFERIATAALAAICRLADQGSAKFAQLASAGVAAMQAIAAAAAAATAAVNALTAAINAIPTSKTSTITVTTRNVTENIVRGSVGGSLGASGSTGSRVRLARGDVITRPTLALIGEGGAYPDSREIVGPLGSPARFVDLVQQANFVDPLINEMASRGLITNAYPPAPQPTAPPTYARPLAGVGVASGHSTVSNTLNVYGMNDQAQVDRVASTLRRMNEGDIASKKAGDNR